jgi:hypothetical protein
MSLAEAIGKYVNNIINAFKELKVVEDAVIDVFEVEVCLNYLKAFASKQSVKLMVTRSSVWVLDHRGLPIKSLEVSHGKTIDEVLSVVFNDGELVSKLAEKCLDVVIALANKIKRIEGELQKETIQ